MGNRAEPPKPDGTDHSQWPTSDQEPIQMRFRSVLPFLVGITLVAVLAGSAVRSSNELIKESEQMRFADRTSLTKVRASQAEQYLTLLSGVVSSMAKAYPL